MKQLRRQLAANYMGLQQTACLNVTTGFYVFYGQVVERHIASYQMNPIESWGITLNLQTITVKKNNWHVYNTTR